MKKKEYIQPQTKTMLLQTENLLAALSKKLKLLLEPIHR